jgi:hypothetical protein
VLAAALLVITALDALGQQGGAVQQVRRARELAAAGKVEDALAVGLNALPSLEAEVGGRHRYVSVLRDDSRSS